MKEKTIFKDCETDGVRVLNRIRMLIKTMKKRKRYNVQKIFTSVIDLVTSLTTNEKLKLASLIKLFNAVQHDACNYFSFN